MLKAAIPVGALIALLVVIFLLGPSASARAPECPAALPAGITCFPIPQGVCYVARGGGKMAGDVLSISCISS